MERLTVQQTLRWRWLVIVTIGVLVFGISMIVTPGFIRQFFGWMIYTSPESLAAFGEPAVAYITLLHGVLGSVMFGWGVALLFILFGPFRRGAPDAWLTLVVSLTAWFLLDTVFSLWAGFWQNAVLNSVFIVLFAIPLAATYRDFYPKRG